MRFNISFRLNKGSALEVFAVQPEQIKREITRLLAPCYHCRKHHSAAVIRHSQFAIEHRHLGIHFSNKCRGEVLETITFMMLPRNEPAIASFNQGQGSKPIVLDFEDPRRIIERNRSLVQRYGNGNSHPTPR